MKNLNPPFSILFALCCVVSASLVRAQSQPSSAEDIKRTIANWKAHQEQSILKNYPARSIGPVVQGGRISDIEVNANDVKEFYVAYASGGVFKTVNNGNTFTPIFDHQGAIGVGDLGLSQSNVNILYVGTGEKNSSRSSYAGSGVYKTTDGGTTWSHLGLENTQHISRVVVHPTNPDIVWVASLGALYTHNDDRGVYKSTDGGATWNKTLFVSDSTGIVDLVIDPSNPDRLWAASWERTRKAWNFKGNGAESAIYKSEDGGNTWQKSTSGFASDNFVGRIGLSVSQSQPNVLYALLDNQEETKEEREQEDDGKFKRQDFLDMTSQTFLALDNKKLGDFLKDNGYPQKYNSKMVKDEIRAGKYQPEALANYFGDANAALFNTTITGAQVYRSNDSGQTWENVTEHKLDGVYFTYGYYFGEIRVDPQDEDKIYIFGVPLLKSVDGGKNFHRLDTLGNVHVDHQALWINPSDPKHILLGNDGGLYQSYDEGATWLHINNVSAGQFYTVNVDMEKPYNVYGGLQDNGVLKGSSRSIPNRTKKWDRIFGGDGMYVAPDPRNSDIVYTGFQFGNYWRLNLETGQRKRITPRHDIGDDRLRFNWCTPVVLSPHNADIVYFGSQRLYRSMDQGETWSAISPDLTTNLSPQGNVPFSTITVVAESPLKFGLIYVGTDDGNLHVSHNAGGSWELVSNSLPQGRWVSKVFASPHSEGTVFVSLNGYRNDEFKTHIYRSDDYGKTWTDIKGDLPESVANVVIQDPKDPNMLYSGLDIGSFVSFNGGQNWHLLNQIPNAASYDMIVHPRELELVVGTHGRSIYVLDVKPLHEIASKVNSGLVAFAPASIRHSSNWGKSRFGYLKPNEPKVEVMYYSSAPGSIEMEVKTDKGDLVTKFTTSSMKGFNQVKWDLKSSQYDKRGREVNGEKKYVQAGKYKITLKGAAGSHTVDFEIKKGR